MTSGGGGGGSIPHLFRCPISLDLFTDPVTLCTGQTYDRPNIERWLAAGNLVCPVTMQRLQDPSIVPNHTLRHLIHTWLLSAAAIPADSSSIGGGSGDLSLGALKRSLQSPDTSSETKLEMLGKVRLLALESDTGQSCLIQLGFVPLLLHLLFGSQGPPSPEFAELALDCVLGLANSPAQMAHLEVLRQQQQGPSSSNSPILDNMIQLFERGNARIRARICRLIERIAGSPSTQALCLLIGRERRVLRTMVALLSRSDASSGSSNTLAVASDAAARALSALCVESEASQVAALLEGALDGLISYLSAGGACTGAALATVERLVVLESGMRQLLGNHNGVRVLVKMVFRVSSPDDGGSEHAVRTLLLACCASPAVRAEAVNAGVLSQLLLLLQSQCGSKAKSEARALLKLLRSMWADDASRRRR